MLSVLIVNWNTKEHLLRCLSSIQSYPPSCPYETIVVDNASTDGSAQSVKESFPDITLIAESRNWGYASGNNIAFGKSSGEFLLTLNPDTEILEGSLDLAIEKMRNQPTIAVLGAKLLDPDGTTQNSVRGFPTYAGLFGDLSGLGKLLPRSKWDSYRLTGFDYDIEQECDQPMGTFLLFRRSALASVTDPTSPFDVQFPIFFNEVDLLYRLKTAGFRILYAPTVRILHHGGASTRLVKKNMIWESHKSLLRYFSKHNRGWCDRLVFPILAILVYLGAFLRAKGYHVGFKA